MIMLPQEYEHLIASLLTQGKFANVEEVIARAFEPLKEEAGEERASLRSKTSAEAVDDILKLRENLTLGGLKIKDLISEGRA